MVQVSRDSGLKDLWFSTTNGMAMRSLIMTVVVLKYIVRQESDYVYNSRLESSWSSWRPSKVYAIHWTPQKLLPGTAHSSHGCSEANFTSQRHPWTGWPVPYRGKWLRSGSPTLIGSFVFMIVRCLVYLCKILFLSSLDLRTCNGMLFASFLAFTPGCWDIHVHHFQESLDGVGYIWWTKGNVLIWAVL